MIKTAIISPCQRYRYQLWRSWDIHGKTVCFVGLNPSTADAEQDDPTITRCINFAKQWDFGNLCMLNLFAYRATEPEEMIKQQAQAFGPLNDFYLAQPLQRCDLTVVCWGANGKYFNQDLHVLRMIDTPMCFEMNKNHTPKHPLYVKSDTKLINYTYETIS